jgi:hypothetical protein
VTVHGTSYASETKRTALIKVIDNAEVCFSVAAASLLNSVEDGNKIHIRLLNLTIFKASN